MPRVKSGSIYYENTRIATMQNVTYRIKPNGSQEVADGGAYNTDGIVTTEVSCDTIVPVAGTRLSVVKDAIEHKDVKLTLGLFDGKIHELEDARCNDIEFTGEAANGTQKGKFSWHAGKPKITG